MQSSIQVAGRVLLRMLEEARSNPSHECCGLLAGQGGAITRVFPARNALASPTAYEIAPPEVFTLFREIRAAGLECTGIYHSHPRSDNAPSTSDIERAYYPDAAYFIVSPLPGAANPIRAFRIRNGTSSEIEISIIE